MANKDRRDQVAQKIKLQKITEIHNHFDKDQDGYLNHSELSSLQSITCNGNGNGNGNNVNSQSQSEKSADMSRNKYKMICTSLGCKANKGIDLRSLVLTYESGGGANIDEDYDAVFNIKRKADVQKKPDTNDDSLLITTKDAKAINPNPAKNSTITSTQSQSESLIDLLTKGDDPMIKILFSKTSQPPDIMDFIIPPQAQVHTNTEEENQQQQELHHTEENISKENENQPRTQEATETSEVMNKKSKSMDMTAPVQEEDDDDDDDKSEPLISYVDLKKSSKDRNEGEHKCMPCTIM